MRQEIDTLLEQLGLYIGHIVAHHRRRARALMVEIRAARQENDYPLCRFLVAHQLHLFEPEREIGFEGVSCPFTSNARKRILLRPPGRWHRRGDFYRILLQTYRAIRDLDGYDFVEPGAAITHRIWLGAAIGRERLTRICACNRLLDATWAHPRTRKRLPVRHILWTDGPTLSESAFHPSGMEFRSHAELLTGENRKFAPHVDAFIRKREFAFAADILRVLALHRHGGLHLGIAWGPSAEPEGTELWRRPDRRFQPTRDTIRVFAIPIHRGGEFSFPFTLTRGQLIPVPHDFRLSHAPDTELLYVGTAASSFIDTLRSSILGILAELPRMVPFGRHVVRNHRLIKAEILRGGTGADRTETTYKRLFDDPSGNVGMSALNVYPLVLALTDHGFLPYFPLIAPNRILERENRFTILKLTVHFHYPMVVLELGLVRQRSRSWLAIPPDYQPHHEL